MKISYFVVLLTALLAVACSGRVIVVGNDSTQTTTLEKSAPSIDNGIDLKGEQAQLVDMWFEYGHDAKNACAGQEGDLVLWDELRFSATEKVVMLKSLQFHLVLQGDASLTNIANAYLFNNVTSYTVGVFDVAKQTITFNDLNVNLSFAPNEESWQYFTIYVTFAGSGTGTYNSLALGADDIVLSEGVVTEDSLPLESRTVVLCP
ncbi:MAG: hypothetical protein NUV81_02135 [bacterium]|nr:hypothetical protein [bacterium]